MHVPQRRNGITQKLQAGIQRENFSIRGGNKVTIALVIKKCLLFLGIIERKSYVVMEVNFRPIDLLMKFSRRGTGRQKHHEQQNESRVPHPTDK